jgi:hypothetical protein
MSDNFDEIPPLINLEAIVSKVESLVLPKCQQIVDDIIAKQLKLEEKL